MIYGCAAVAVICIVGVIVTALGVKYAFNQLRDAATDSEPIELQKVELPDAERDALIERVDSWKAALDEGGETTALILSEQDVNGLIQYHESFENARDNLYVSIADSKITGDMSWPLDDFSIPGLAGRYFNGSVEFEAELRDGRLEVYITGGTVKGDAIPDEALEGLRVQNLADGYNQNPEARKSLEMIESIEIRGDTIVITPVGAEAEAEAEAEVEAEAEADTEAEVEAE
jgi:hypothetical protein